MDEICVWCGHGLPAEQYQEARALIEDLLIEWDAVVFRQNNPELEMVVEDLRKWLSRQPGHPVIQG